MAPRDGEKFHAELTRVLTRPTAFEAVMRVRATRGLRITNFYGNYFIRGTDLLALPNCTPDSVFAVEFGYDEQVLTASVISVQVQKEKHEKPLRLPRGGSIASNLSRHITFVCSGLLEFVK